MRTTHQKHALLPMANGGELAALFSWSFLAIAIVGAGPLALDALLASSRPRRAAAGAGKAQRWREQEI